MSNELLSKNKIKPDRKKIVGSLLLLLASFIWGTAFVAQRVGMEKIEPITFNAARMWYAAIFIGLVALVFWLKERQNPHTTGFEERKKYNYNTVLGGILCGAFLSAASIFQQMGMVYTSAGKAGFITVLYILLVPVINLIIFRKKSPWNVWLAVAVGLCGMYLLCVKEQFSFSYGDILVIICAFLFSCHIICCDRFVKLGNALRISAMQFLTAAVISTIVAFIAEKPDSDKIISAIIPILYCGVLSGGVAFTLQMIAQKNTDPTVAALIMSFESVFAALAGTVLLGESMTVKEIIGCVIMFIAIIAVQIPLPNQRNKDIAG